MVVNTKDEESVGHLLEEVLRNELNVSIQRMTWINCHTFLWYKGSIVEKAHKSLKPNVAISSSARIFYSPNTGIEAYSIPCPFLLDSVLYLLNVARLWYSSSCCGDP